MLRVRAGELETTLAHPFLHEDLGHAEPPLLVVDVDDPLWPIAPAAQAALLALPAVTVAVVPTGVLPHVPTLSPAFDLLLESDQLDSITSAVTSSPQASVVLAQVLRLGEQLSVRDALITESLAYSTLQSGPKFQQWLQESDYGSSGIAATTPKDPPAVLVEPTDREYLLTLNRPERHNAFNAEMRDLFVEAFRIAIEVGAPSIRVRGNGPTFCSGGDLTEFGTTPDSATAHMVRSTRSAPWWVHLAKERTTFELHGACFGAGIELAAFADRVISDPEATVSLPEVRFGLIPGAGGTVSIPRRIGRHRTLWLALTGAHLDASTAMAWGLVDQVVSKSS